MNSFIPVRKHETINGQTGLVIGRKIMTAGPTVFATKRTAKGREYMSYSILGTTVDADGTPRSTTFKLGHLLNGGYGTLKLEDGEGNPIDATNLDDSAKVPSLQADGTKIEGSFRLTEVTANFTGSSEPQEFLFLKTDNQPILTTMIAVAPKVTNDEFDALFASIANGVLDTQN